MTAAAIKRSKNPFDGYEDDPFHKEADTTVPEAHTTSEYDDEVPVNPDVQAGIQNIQAITAVWPRSALIMGYIMIWVIYFVDSMQQGVTGQLTPWIMSSFMSHSLTPSVGIMSSIISGVFKLTLAKILDVFGRPQGYFLCVCLPTVGLVMMAGCNNVETYAAAQVFYWVG